MMGDETSAASGARMPVSLATPEELEAARRHWPALAALPEPQEIHLLRESTGGAIGGAVAIDLYPVPFRITGRAIRLFVDDDSQAHTARLALLDAAAHVVRRTGCAALYAGDSAAQGSEAWNSWQSLGFEPVTKLAHYEVELDTYLKLLTPMYDALTVRGHVPIEARIIPLAESPIGEVIQLHMEFIGGDAGRLESRLRGRGYYPFHPQLSRIAMLDDHVCGVLLVQLDRYGRLMVESRVVAPGHRRRWVNVAVMQEAAQAGARQGFDRIRFLANERHRDTHRLAEKAGRAMHRRDVMVRRVGRSP